MVIRTYTATSAAMTPTTAGRAASRFWILVLPADSLPLNQTPLSPRCPEFVDARKVQPKPVCKVRNHCKPLHPSRVDSGATDRVENGATDNLRGRRPRACKESVTWLTIRDIT